MDASTLGIARARLLQFLGRRSGLVFLCARACGIRWLAPSNSPRLLPADCV